MSERQFIKVRFANLDSIVSRFKIERWHMWYRRLLGFDRIDDEVERIRIAIVESDNVGDD
jgi:hypothetical protein